VHSDPRNQAWGGDLPVEEVSAPGEPVHRGDTQRCFELSWDDGRVASALSSLQIDIRVSRDVGRNGVIVMTAAVHPMIDGRDVVAEVFDPGPGHAPELLLSPAGPLCASEEPHEVELAEAECTWGCCGALCVTIRRDGDQVVWGQWRDRNGPEPELPEFRFDAEDYGHEVARVEQDHSWEWPVRTVARLLDSRLRAQPERLGRWQFGLGRASSWKPDEVDVLLFHPRRPSTGGPWLQFRKVLTVNSDDPAIQAARFEAELTENDPRGYGEICGGSAEFARELGFEWPAVRR
jgi:hypothetical protein